MPRRSIAGQTRSPSRGSWPRTGRGVVVKADGLAAGKGVTVCEDPDEAERAIVALAAARAAEHGTGATTDGSDPEPWVVVEERLAGREASLIAICDGRIALALPMARDHKRLLDGDHGPNTGGMGAYSPLPDLPDEAAESLLDAFHRPILAELARRGTPFRGALYAGLMLTDDGPVLLECNARFGDPETQAILPRLAVALGPILLAAARGDLSAALADPAVPVGSLPTLPGATVAIVLAAGGYPDAPRSGDAVEGLAGRSGDRGARLPRRHAVDGDGTVRTTRGRVVSGRRTGRGRAGCGCGRDASRRHDPRAGPPAAARHRGGPSPDHDAARSEQPAGSLAR